MMAAMAISAFALMLLPAAAQSPDIRWGEPGVLFDAGSGARVFNPFVVPDPYGGVHVLWEVTTEGTQGESEYANGIYCVDGDGVTWSEPVDVIVDPAGSRTFWPQHAISDAGRLVVVWVGGNLQLYVSVTDAADACLARSWRTGVVAAAGQVQNAAVAVDSEGALHVAYAARGQAVYYIQSSDEGLSWSAPVAVSTARPDVASAMPEIAVDADGRIHVVWEEAQLPQGVPGLGVYYARSVDGGVSFEPARTLADGKHTQPNVAALDDGTLHLFWNGRAGTQGRYHQWSQDGGANWSPVLTILAPGTGGGQTGAPRWAVDSSGALHLVTGTDNSDHVSWTGSAWGSGQNITAYDAFGNMEHQNIGISRGRELHVVANASTVRIIYVRGVTDAPELPVATRSVTDGTPAPEPMTLSTPVSEAAVDRTVAAPMDSEPQSRDNAALPFGLGALSATAVLVAALVVARSRSLR
ncbi:MAG: exo-alpha-sialidase [Chloroflexi bacterium]|nr:exo-alpha-sialidase [Chloroflexota bacterium]